MKRFITICAIAALAASPALAGSGKELARYEEISAGQSKDEVTAIMHEPGNREFKGSQEAWQYCARSGLSANKFVVVYFNNGTVDRLMTYTRPWMGSCKGAYKPVAWDAEPANGAQTLSATPAATITSPTDALAGQ